MEHCLEARKGGRVATWATVWKVLGSLPGTEQGLLHDNPAVRVRGKLVAYLPNNRRSRPAHATGHEEFLVVRCDLGERAALLAEDPETFFVTPHYQTYPGVIVRLATVRPDQLRELLTEAWRLVAPKRLVRELDET
ncbi:MAG TPA: MmcQ/YjbR family DNA-binding protein [Actinomycetes bacterium]|nr:MmcQ/YjbR family DNA-binding protein [Actinomycetes bacterium]